MRILLTEDDHPLANTMLSMLRDGQNTVDWLDDGQQALNALLNEIIKTILRIYSENFLPLNHFIIALC